MFSRLAKYFFDINKQPVVNNSPAEVYATLLSTLHPTAVGYGKDVHSVNEDRHWSTAYSLILSAELSKLAVDNQGANSRILQCVEWLLNNSGCSSTSAPLWTLPYQRQIWEDACPVKEHTAFCIPSAHSIQSLVEFSQCSSFGGELKMKALDATVKASAYYSEHCFDSVNNGIIFWYSTLQQHSFHVTNATSMMAGQLQRVAHFTSVNPALKMQTDSAISHLLSLKNDYSGIYGWNYFGQKIPSNKSNKTNDLLHEAFVCHGLLDYKLYRGSLGDSYQYQELYESLGRFVRNGKLYEFSDAEQNSNRKKHFARAIAMGHALYVASRLEPLLESKPATKLSDLAFNSISQDYIKGGRLFHRPCGEDVTDRVRVVSHVLLGVAEYQKLLQTN